MAGGWCVAGGHAWQGACITGVGDMHGLSSVCVGGVHNSGNAWCRVCMAMGGMCHGGHALQERRLMQQTAILLSL